MHVAAIFFSYFTYVVLKFRSYYFAFKLSEKRVNLEKHFFVAFMIVYTHDIDFGSALVIQGY